MCGIAGFAGRGERSDLTAMHARLAHRGPDGEGMWSDPSAGVHLAHRRLSIVDHAGGAQPMWDARGEIAVCFNGEIYNHGELRRELEARGHRFASDHSDTEVLVHGYREWSAGLAARLNGMWAFAVLDRVRRRLMLSRDRFGEKPLYWTRQGETFAFASELTALRAHSLVRSEIDPLGVRKYLAHGFNPAPGTIYRGVFKLPAGHDLVFDLDAREPRIDRWFEFVPEPDPRLADAPIGEHAEHLHALLAKAVRRRLMADVPLGVFLSGGVDSSAIAALAVGARPDAPTRTFSIGFEDASFDESAHAERVARHLGTEHHPRRLGVDEALRAAPAIAARLDEPIADSSLVPTWLLCGLAREQVTVALSGDGGDELFAGYAPFRALDAAARYARAVPAPVHRAIRALAGMLPTRHSYFSLDFKIKRTLRGLSWPASMWNPVWLGPLEPAEIADALDEPIEPERLYSEAIEAWDRCPSDDPLDKATAFYVKLYLQDDILVKADRASMLHSLEVRAPFLDPEVVEFARRLPRALRLGGGVTKRLLREALTGVLPRETLARAKQGFAMPVGPWFRDGRLDLAGDARGGGVRPAFARRMLAEHRGGRADHRLYLWAQWVLDRHADR